MVKKVLKLLHCDPVVEMPKEVRRRKNMILTIELVSTAFLDLLSFGIKGAQTSINHGLKLIAFLFVLAYFLRDVLQATIKTFTDTQKTNFYGQQDSYTAKNVQTISDTVRGKVFSKDAGFSKLMIHSQTIEIMKEFIGYIWQFTIQIPIVIFNSIIAIILSFGIIVTEFIQTQNLYQTLYLSGILVVCIIIFIIVYSIRLKISQEYREEQRKLRKETEALYNDVKNTEPLIPREFFYRLNLLVDNLTKKRATEKEQGFKLNIAQLVRTLTLAAFMIGIIVIKLYYTGGIKNLSLLVVTDILAVSSVYSAILNKVVNILRDIEEMTNLFRNAESVKKDFDNIMSVYYNEISNTKVIEQFVEKITIAPFTFSYSTQNSVYTLQNSKPFELQKGKTYLVHGHTGCGKSTLMHILVGKIKLDESPISYGSSCERAYLTSIMHESNGKLGSNPILEEIIFSKDFSNVDMPKLIEILKGTFIYEDILRNLGLKVADDEKVLNYLKQTTIEQYSSGQKQRLSIVKVLYNLALAHQIVVFDEATNALDNATAESVLRFMANFCQKDTQRITFFVTHQVDITEKITDASITFSMENFPVFEIILENPSKTPEPAA